MEEAVTEEDVHSLAVCLTRQVCAGKMAESQRKRKQELCPLSLKDISTIEILPQILEAGVTSLKIEGRMKAAGIYSRGDTSVYRKYLDLLFEKGV